MDNKTPQLEDGFIRISTEIWEVLGHYRLSGEEWLVLNCVIRKTYGWNKKEDRISFGQFSKYTALKRPTVARAIKKLLSKKIIGVIKKDNTKGNLYCFNKLYSQWIAVIKKDNTTKSVIKKDNRGVIKKDNKVLSKKINTIDNTINTNTKDNRENNFIFLFKSVNPSYERLFRNKTEREAAKRLLDKYGVEKMSNLLKNLPSIIQQPYAPTITTPYELEVKMGKLLVFLNQEKIKGNKYEVTKV